MKKTFLTLSMLFLTIIYVQTAHAQWSLTGNAGTNSLLNYVGTTDANALVFRTNALEAMRISTSQNVGIGISTPTHKLDITTSNTLRTVSLSNNNSTNSTKYGVYNAVTNAGNGGRYGIYNSSISANGSTGTNFGLYNFVSHPGTGPAYGIYSSVSGGTGSRYGVFSIATGTNAYALYASGRAYISDKLGIGELNPIAKLHVDAVDVSLTSPGSIVIGAASGVNIGIDNNEIEARNDSAAADLFLQNDAGAVIINGAGNVNDVSLSSNGAFVIGNTSANNMTMDYNEIQTRYAGGEDNLYINKGGGNVYIGTSNGSEKLNVCGGIKATEVRVESGWCDYVFADDYQLRSLDEVADFIDQNNHLPNIPAAVVVETEGLSLGQMSRSMMEKIEELTLYLIDQNAQLKSQDARIMALAQQNEELMKQLNGLK